MCFFFFFFSILNFGEEERSFDLQLEAMEQYMEQKKGLWESLGRRSL